MTWVPSSCSDSSGVDNSRPVGVLARPVLILTRRTRMSHRPATMDSVIFRRAQSLFSSFVVVDAGVPEDDGGAVVVDVDVRGGREH